jgi:BirA family biotin operon repressor/biotin-[acetyl-CoA-carboxylase] ligase
MLGQEVRVRLPNGELTGVAEDVDHSGALLLRDATGQLHTITAGDVGN